MAGQPPRSSSLPWAWVIEALANFKEVDIATLIDVFKTSPEISSDFGSKAREIVSFRILERLFDQDTQPIKSIFSAPNSRVRFDFSEQCEDVLRRILGEQMRVPTIWDESEKSKWDARPFIAYKRQFLLKCDLQQLKDALVEGRLSHLTFLKQKASSLHHNPSIDDKGRESSKKTRTLNDESESSSDDEWYHKETDHISVAKKAFFSSKSTEMEAANHGNGENWCMKCKKGGRLLVCGSDSCSFMFHDSCLVSGSSFDGGYYCPFCIYSRAISDYWVVKEKADLARNDVGSFKSSTLKYRPKNEASYKKERSEVMEGALPLRIYVTEENDNVVSNPGVSDLRDESLESSEEANCVDGSVRSRKPIKPCTYLHVPQRRRFPVPWTQLEEETLKKWVEKLGAISADDRGVPWRKILDLGATVFQKSRRPGDLKDKWRNMQKASTKST